MSQESERVAGWALEEKLGAGAFSTVWRARRPEVGLPRALKIVAIASAHEFQAWRHEVQRLDSFNTDDVVRFYDAGIVDTPGQYQNHAWIATELCVRSLADDLHRSPSGTLPAETCERVLAMILRALVTAEDQGCVHRDVKPANILLASNGRWKLADFGIARLLPMGELYTDTAVIGTKAYMSPGALSGRQDHAADRYALGVTLHEALTGAVLHPRRPGMSDFDYLSELMRMPPTIDPRLEPRWRNVIEVLVGAHGRIDSAAILHWFIATGASSVPQGPGPSFPPDDESPTIDVNDFEPPGVDPPAYSTTKLGTTKPGAVTAGTPGRRRSTPTPTPARALHLQSPARLRPWMAATSGAAIILVLFLLVRLAG